MTFLDWRSNKIGDPLPCRICSRPAICRDDDNRPTHKVCAEQQAVPLTASPVRP